MFFFVWVCFALSFHGDLRRFGLGEVDVLIYKRICNSFIVSSLTFSIHIMHIAHDFTLFLSLGCFVVILDVFEGIKVNFRVFEALACILRFF